MRHAGTTPWRSALDLARRAVRRRSSPPPPCGRYGSAQGTTCCRARQSRLPAQRVQPAADRLPRRRPPLARRHARRGAAGDPVRGRRAGAGVRAGPRARRPDRARSTFCSRPRSSSGCLRRATVGCSAHECRIATFSRPTTRSSSSARSRSRSARSSWPASRRSSRSTGRRCRCFGSARVPRVAAATSSARETARLFARGGLGGRHGRRPRRDGGGEPRLPRGRRAVGRLRHRAAARAADEPYIDIGLRFATSTPARRCS